MHLFLFFMFRFIFRVVLCVLFLCLMIHTHVHVRSYHFPFPSESVRKCKYSIVGVHLPKSMDDFHSTYFCLITSSSSSSSSFILFSFCLIVHFNGNLIEKHFELFASRTSHLAPHIFTILASYYKYKIDTSRS